MTPSARLLELMQQGDLLALDELVRTSGDRLLAVARRRCHRKDDAEDAVQQALLAASTSLQGFRGEGSALAWLSTLVARSCYRLNEKGDVAEYKDDEDCGCESAEAVAERHQLGAQLGAALMKLSRTDRLAFLLSADGFSSQEIAARFALSDDAVRSRLKRARKILRAALGAPGDTGDALSGTARHAHNDEHPLKP